MDFRKFTMLTFFLFLLFYSFRALGQIKEIELKLKHSIGSIREVPEQNSMTLHWVNSIDFDGTGNIYVMDAGNQRILKFDKDYNLLWQIGRRGKGPGEFLFASRLLNTGVLMVKNNNDIFIADKNNARVQIFDKDGIYVRQFCRLPWTISGNMDIDENECVYIGAYTTTDNNLIYVFNKDSEYVGSFVKKLFECNSRNTFKLLYNRFNFSINRRNDIIVSFNYWPVIRKYDSHRSLIWEKELSLKNYI